MFGQRLKELRCDQEMTQKQLAEKLKVQPAAISKYEKEKSEPSLSTLIILGQFFKVSLDYLTGQSDIKNPYEKEMTLSAGEIEFVRRFKQLNSTNQIRIDERIAALLDVQRQRLKGV